MKTRLQALYLRKNPHIAPFSISLDQNAISNGKNNGTPYANQNLGMEIQWKTLARQKADMEFASYYNKEQRAIRQKNASGRMKGNGARDKRYNVKKQISWNKRMWAWIQSNSLRWTKDSRLEKAWNYKRKKVNQMKRKPGNKAIPSRWRRPGTTAWIKRTSIGSQRNRGAKQYKAAGEDLQSWTKVLGTAWKYDTCSLIALFSTLWRVAFVQSDVPPPPWSILLRKSALSAHWYNIERGRGEGEIEEGRFSAKKCRCPKTFVQHCRTSARSKT